VKCCDISNQGDIAASCADDTTIILWDLQSGKIQDTLRGHNNTVTSCKISPKGDQLASGSWDCKVIIWSVSKGKMMATLSGHTDWVLCVTYSEDGAFVVSGGCDNNIIVWDSQRRREQCKIQAHSNWVSSVTVTGHTVLSSSLDGTLKAWQLESGAPILSLTEHTKGVNSCATMFHGTIFLSASNDGTLKVWKGETGEKKGDFVCSSPCTAVAALNQIALADSIGHIYMN